MFEPRVVRPDCVDVGKRFSTSCKFPRVERVARKKTRGHSLISTIIGRGTLVTINTTTTTTLVQELLLLLLHVLPEPANVRAFVSLCSRVVRAKEVGIRPALGRGGPGSDRGSWSPSPLDQTPSEVYTRPLIRKVSGW